MSTPALSRLYLLGSFRLEKMGSNPSSDPANAALIQLPARKLESLLAYLVLHPQPHAREKLAALNWGDSSDQRARDSLRNALAVLRKFLGDELLLASHDTAQLNPAYPLWVDAIEFKKLANVSPESAIELYHGELLADFYDDWTTVEREEHRTLYLNTLLQLTQQMRAQSEYDRAIEFAQRILVSDAPNERAHQQLMFCYFATGNRSAALQQYEKCSSLLQAQLGVTPAPETVALFQWIKQQTTSAPSPEARITNLPIPLTSFIGRGHEIGQLKEILANARLLTLTGAGGSGKTRLAIQAASDLMNGFKDGGWWVELAAITDVALVPQAVAKALGVQEDPERPLLETLVNYLHSKHLLLVLDNCEHLVTACARLTETLLAACPALKILATSRESLEASGEALYQVPTLSLPASGDSDLAGILMQYEGIRLFVERAHAIHLGFELTNQNALAVLEVCQRLDGIPLAIELAAARVAILSVREIAARLDDRFNFLTVGSRTALPRQQTLRAMIDWSYDLLSENERTLLRRLSVFAGGLTLEAAESICADDALPQRQVLDLLSHLVRKSLVMVEVLGGATRYGMLDTIWHYAREKLQASGEWETLQSRHLSFYLMLAQETGKRMHSAAHSECINLLEQELDNFRASLRWARESTETDSGLRLIGPLGLFWLRRGYWTEGREWARSLLAAAGSSAAEDALARGYLTAATLTYSEGYYEEARKQFEAALSLFESSRDAGGMAETHMEWGNADFVHTNYAEAKSHLESSLAISRAIGFKWVIAESLHYMGHVMQGLGQDAEAHNYYAESVSVFREMNYRVNLSFPLSDLGLEAQRAGDYPAARAIFEENLSVFNQEGNNVGRALMMANLGYLELAMEEDVKARAYFEKSLSIFHQMGSTRYMAECFEGLAAVAVSKSQPVRAAGLFGVAENMREVSGIGLPPYRQADYDHYSAALRSQLDEGSLAKAWAEGRALTRQQAIELALTTADP